MKIVKMKDLAVSYKLKNAKQFKTTENYLEYVINEINKKGTKYKFHQFLLLIEVLYVILDEKVDQRLTPTNEIKNHYEVPSTADYDDLREFEKRANKKVANITNEDTYVADYVKENTPGKPINPGVFKKQKLAWK